MDSETEGCVADGAKVPVSCTASPAESAVDVLSYRTWGILRFNY